HKFEVLREHCAAEGRDYAAIEKTNLSSIDLSADGREGTITPAGLVERVGAWAEAGSQHVIFSVRRVDQVEKLELIGREVIPQVRDLGEPSPIG
ncbi:MAG TPA: hypothetical protein VFK38_06975, partial [Candidatus Limnocylindrales bacterium]|nr:hypothetical protein [Candidatus Limnocylindrales bacterium]